MATRSACWSSTASDAARDLNLIAAYLARRDAARLSDARADVLVLCGSGVLYSVEITAQVLHDGRVRRILVTGGAGHSTRFLREAVRARPVYDDVRTEGRSEAAIMADILRMHHEVPETAIAIEELATNCGENAKFTLDMLRRQTQPPRSILLIQDPTMQRRTHACFHRRLRDDSGATVTSYAPFVPRVADAGDVKDPLGRIVWSSGRFTALALGEMRRLHDTEAGYGPNGADFIDHIDIPNDVMDAYQRVTRDHPESAREAWSG